MEFNNKDAPRNTQESVICDESHADDFRHYEQKMHVTEPRDFHENWVCDVCCFCFQGSNSLYSHLLTHRMEEVCSTLVALQKKRKDFINQAFQTDEATSSTEVQQENTTRQSILFFHSKAAVKSEPGNNDENAGYSAVDASSEMEGNRETIGTRARLKEIEQYGMKDEAVEESRKNGFVAGEGTWNQQDKVVAEEQARQNEASAQEEPRDDMHSLAENFGGGDSDSETDGSSCEPDGDHNYYNMEKYQQENQQGSVENKGPTRPLQYVKPAANDGNQENERSSVISETISLAMQMVPGPKKRSREPHPCPICDKVLSSRGNLAKHLICHSSVKPFKCETCSMEFNSRRDCKIHKMSKHTGERPCICAQCGKGFVTKHYLTEHMAYHSKEKSYTCDICGTSYFTKLALTKHQKRHTGLWSIICEHCGKRFKLHHDLKAHIARKHWRILEERKKSSSNPGGSQSRLPRFQ